MRYIPFLLVAFGITGCSESSEKETNNDKLIIEWQGGVAVGGTVQKEKGSFNPKSPEDPAGQTLHVDHATVQYQIPEDAKDVPLVFWHGFGQTSRTWQTTPDGREGFQTLFLRKKFPVYLLDQPRRGQAGVSTEQASITPTPNEQYWFGMFRLGIGTEYFPDVQFSKDPEVLNQFYRMVSPDLGKIDFDINAQAVSALFDRIGPGVLVTHSNSGGQGWLTALKNDKIKGIVSYEPGSGFVFPEGETPEAMQSSAGPLEAVTITKEDFIKLTKFPIVIYYGDFIPDEPSENYGTDNWRTRLAMARLFCDVVNKHGGDAQVIHLPKVGIKGNTHFPMSDLNNVQVAELMADWLKEKKLN